VSKKPTVSRDEVLKIASLAKLNLSEDEVDLYTDQMNEILDYMRQLDELDTENVEPLSHVLDQLNITRRDEEEPSLSRADALSNAPDSDGEYFVVPSVIEKS
jgi:aspartyl-tRNA(Asn)/glutamyl-tRNA(Gln) amidotransferase subunit C